MKPSPFILEKVDTGSHARAGRLLTAHGEVQTPVFMPVGTFATVRGQNVETLEAAGSTVLLANTYHLWIRPGLEVFEKFGDIHRFMKWGHSVLTDSGGFQVFSLASSREITENGVAFKSYPDGKPRLLTPEISIGIQKRIGSDIMMAFDHCVESTCTIQQAAEAMERTHRWAKRSLEAHGESTTRQSLFGIVQGAIFPELRKQSAEVISSLGFDGFAIGGLAVGESKTLREDMVALTAPLLPADRPRYLMGVGTPIDLLEAVYRGVDMFDCILPTALAPMGVAFTSQGKIDLRRGFHKLSDLPLDANCPCHTCSKYSRAYLHHLVRSQEILRWQLIGTHNLYFYHDLMRRMRAAILEGRFGEFYEKERKDLVRTDAENPPSPIGRGIELPPARGNFEVVTGRHGFSSLKHISGETLHSVNDPWLEAKQLYVDQSGMRELLQQPGEPLVVWDVGLGAAFNAMAAIVCYETLAKENLAKRPMRLISFENDLDALALGLQYANLFPHLRHQAPGSRCG